MQLNNSMPATPVAVSRKLDPLTQPKGKPVQFGGFWDDVAEAVVESVAEVIEETVSSYTRNSTPSPPRHYSPSPVRETTTYSSYTAPSTSSWTDAVVEGITQGLSDTFSSSNRNKTPSPVRNSSPSPDRNTHSHTEESSSSWADAMIQGITDGVHDAMHSATRKSTPSPARNSSPSPDRTTHSSAEESSSSWLGAISQGVTEGVNEFSQSLTRKSTPSPAATERAPSPKADRNVSPAAPEEGSSSPRQLVSQSPERNRSTVVQGESAIESKAPTPNERSLSLITHKHGMTGSEDRPDSRLSPSEGTTVRNQSPNAERSSSPDAKNRGRDMRRIADSYPQNAQQSTSITPPPKERSLSRMTDKLADNLKGKVKAGIEWARETLESQLQPSMGKSEETYKKEAEAFRAKAAQSSNPAWRATGEEIFDLTKTAILQAQKDTILHKQLDYSATWLSKIDKLPDFTGALGFHSKHTVVSPISGAATTAAHGLLKGASWVSTQEAERDALQQHMPYIPKDKEQTYDAIARAMTYGNGRFSKTAYLRDEEGTPYGFREPRTKGSHELLRAAMNPDTDPVYRERSFKYFIVDKNEDEDSQYYRKYNSLSSIPAGDPEEAKSHMHGFHIPSPEWEAGRAYGRNGFEDSSAKTPTTSRRTSPIRQRSRSK